MRLISFISLVILINGCASSRNATMKPGKLNGTWVPVKQEMGGIELPKTGFDSQKLSISDTMYTFAAESVDKGIIKYKDDKMDIYGKEGVNTGRHFTALYKYENDQLTICYNLKGDSYPDAFETKSKQSLFLCIYRKEQSK